MAYAGLADAYYIMGWWGWLPKNEGFSKGKEYAQKAKEFNSTLTATAGKFGLSNKAKLGDYRRAWWVNEINNQEKKLGIKFSPSQK